MWLVDLGLAAKIRSCVVVSVPADDLDRTLVTLVPHTASTRGSRFEVHVPVRFLKSGAFDAQGLVTVPQVRLVRRMGLLLPTQMAALDDALRAWLGIGEV